MGDAFQHSLNDVLQRYPREIEIAYRAGNATEHSYRSYLKRLLEAFLPGIVATNEPKHIKYCGAPDFVITRNHIPLGYLETKDIGVSLDQVERTEQMRRYRDGLGNLILTDYLEFRWYVAGQPRMQARLVTPLRQKQQKISRWIVDVEGLQQVNDLLRGFLLSQVPTISTPKELASRMATIAQLIRNAIQFAFNSERGAGSLHGQFESFKKVLLPDLTPERFADMYSQAICYGLFAARCQTKPGTSFTRERAAYDIPHTNPFLRQMFSDIVGPKLDESIVWIVDNLVAMLARTDIEAILRGFSRQMHQEDPVIHFYETFLAQYDPKIREMRGVYYTPEPVVSYIIRSVDALLKRDFHITNGFADASRVKTADTEGNPKEVHRLQILDPATGTGTFLHSIIHLIYHQFDGNKGMWSSYVSQHLLPRIFGFELLMAPYAVAHMKLGLQLRETGYDFSGQERLGVYLTNTLENDYQQAKLPFAEWLAEEATAANAIKQQAPVMVVVGNPPYSYDSQNKGNWITALLKDYYQLDGAPLQEKNPKGLQDDYVKFLRFAQWRIQQTGYGIVAFILNHRFLDNPTFPGLRQSLLGTFDDLYLLNLHGSTKPKEEAPEHILDQNVFDIQQGVVIGIFVKHSTEPKTANVYYADLWGKREAKYAWLLEHNSLTTSWATLHPQSPAYYFIPQTRHKAEEYEQGWRLTDIMPVNSVGLYTARDDLAIQWTGGAMQSVVTNFISLDVETARTTYDLGSDARDWKVALAQKDIRAVRADKSKVQPVAYRPFDIRFTYYTGVSRGFICMPRSEVMHNLVERENLALCFMRRSREQNTSNFFVARYIIDKTILSSADNANVAPLYLYDKRDPQMTFAEMRPSASIGERHANLSSAFVEYFTNKISLRFISDGKGDLWQTVGPEDIFNYIYAIFYSPTYRKRYAEFLKLDFPRLLFTSQIDMFRSVSLLGARLVALHLMEHNNITTGISDYPEQGNNVVEKIEHRAGVGANTTKETGRVYINYSQYFDDVPTNVWEFHIGGYQVCQKWLKDRKGRVLNFDDIACYQRIIAILKETIGLMKRIDDAIDAYGGWPIK